MAWSSQQYVKFEDERTRPVRDLVSAIQVERPARMIDLGCGPGNSTQVLAQRFPDSLVAGLDSSLDMIAAARQRLPGVAFEVGDIGLWGPVERYDVILANAALHWVVDHRALFPRLASYLAPGGNLAVQMPDNMNEPAHVAMREVAAGGPWDGKLRAAGERAEVASAAEYYALLRPLCSRVDVWRTTYHHPLAGVEGIVDWFKGSALRPYLAALDAGEQAAFLDAYAERLGQVYRADAEGIVLLPFPRLFVVAVRG